MFPALPADPIRWHQDIDPSNILVVSRGESSVYDCDFKIADLGLSHFKKYAQLPENDVAQDTFGTSAYGQSSHAHSRLHLANSIVRLAGNLPTKLPPPKVQIKGEAGRRYLVFGLYLE